MRTMWLQWRRAAAFFHDFLGIPIAWLGAYWLRFNMGEIPPDMLSHALGMLPWVMLCQTLAFWAFGLYRGVWRFASIPDLIRIIKALMMGSLMAILAIFLVERLQFLPRSVVPLYSLLLLFILGGSRFVYRWSKDKSYPAEIGERALIVGAGAAGESLVRELLREQKTHRTVPIAFVDDRPQKQGREVHGVRVVGKCDDILDVVKRYAIDRILIAVPSATASEMRRISRLCESTGKPVRTLPGTQDLVSGLVSVKNLRDVSLEDLLGRDPIALDWKAITNSLAEKVVLVSGGGGSIGSELCRQILRLVPSTLIIIDNSEYNLFCIEQELNEKFPDLKSNVQYYLLDIGDQAALGKLIQKAKPQIIFHAAAYKHVPLLEPQVRAASKNNILGTYYLAQLAVINRVEKFVLVSTDKAVNPTNIMGATKRIAELVCQYFNDAHRTQFVTVRFGNVLGSRGSVVETFQRQLEKGGPLTVTHPEVVRYFMTVQEASQLILQAMVLGEGGEVFVLDMGEPVKIRYMAEQMIRLSGKKFEDILIEYIGLRPGEKLFEELFHQREKLALTSHVKILKALHRDIERATFESELEKLQEGINSCEEVMITEVVQRMVPELNSREPSQSILAEG